MKIGVEKQKLGNLEYSVAAEYATEYATEYYEL